MLIKEPAEPWAHSRARSLFPSLASPFTPFRFRSLSSFYFMVSLFKGLSFVFRETVGLSHSSVEWTYC